MAPVIMPLDFREYCACEMSSFGEKLSCVLGVTLPFDFFADGLFLTDARAVCCVE